MRAFAALYLKELRELFATPIALVLLAVFWALAGWFFSFGLFFVNVAQMVGTFHNISLLLLLVLPLVTMRTFAEENKSGTLELLLSLPLSESQIVLAKFAASATLLVLMLGGSATAVVPLVLFAQPDFGPIVGGYLGLAMLGAAFLGIGLLVSALTSNQIIAALITWGVLTLLWFADYAATLDAFPALRGLFQHLSLSAHTVDVIRGVVNLGSLVYFTSALVVALALTIAALKARRA